MSGFAIRTPYLIIVACLMVFVLGVSSVARMPVDMFPSMNVPVVIVATFYSGMPPEQIEGNITYHLERFFTLASGIDHMESRSLDGVSIIRVYFQPDTNADTDAATIANLAVSDMKDLPPGTFPPVVLKSDASSLPVCLVTMNGPGMTDGALKDIAQNFVRNQLAGVPGASIPQPFGGPWRQIQLYVDPYKMEARQMSAMDVVRAMNQANIMPAGDVQIGNLDYDIYSNAQFNLKDASQYPVKMNGENPVLMSDIGELKDAHALQYNVVHVNGQRSVYLPVLKQGGNSNTITVVSGIRSALHHLVDVPPEMRTTVVFDQSRFVRTAIETLLHEGGIGLFLTCLMILIFLGSLRATLAVFFSIPLSVLATFMVLQMNGSSVNSMVLGGLALALSRLIDNSVVVLENIYRHLEMGEASVIAAEKGGKEVALPVLASTLTTAIVFFPVTLLSGVSKFLFSAMALAVVVALFASYVIAMTVVPLYCSKYLKLHNPEGFGETHAGEARTLEGGKTGFAARFNAAFNKHFEKMLAGYEVWVHKVLRRPAMVLIGFAVVFVLSLGLYGLLGFSYFPQTDAGQFVINLKAPSGTRLLVTEQEVAKAEAIIKQVVHPADLNIIVDNIGVDNGFSAIYTSNAAMHTGFIQVGLTPGHEVGSYAYIARIKRRLAEEMPELTTYFSTGSLVDAVVNMGAPAPIDIQISSADLQAANQVAQSIASTLRSSSAAADVFIPQDLDYPSLRINVDRLHAAKLGLTEKEVLSNVITSLTSNQMIAPNVWIDPRNGNNYFLTVQYPEAQIRTVQDLQAIPLHAEGVTQPTRLDMVANIQQIEAPTEVDHYQIRRKLDIYVRPATEDLGKTADVVRRVIAQQQIPAGISVAVRGSASAMSESFRSFTVGLMLSVILLYLVLVAQFRSFVDPFIILLALPPGITGVLLVLVLTGTTMNVMSLMGVVMLAGIAMSNSILIVEFAHHLMSEGHQVGQAIIESCRVRLRPILMTSLATVIGLLPMAMKLGEGSESYAPLARALVGGLIVSTTLAVFLVPAGFFLVYGRKTRAGEGI
jgi:multidrug efflux pump subunit AcrB